ncbi:MAG TPA: GuaB1 family IMP dehydrogenase-related protein, partial [Microbacterium sp.]|nr:GuaB1 family IMP dehydrogenase-related protein [Microbacterium sp.]
MEFYGAQPEVDLTYSDVFLVPRRSEVASRLDVDLAPDDGTPATLPLVAANMNS